jgi:hypothetical protein
MDADRSAPADPGPWLRPTRAPAGSAPGPDRGDGSFDRGGWVVHRDRRLGQLIARRPEGITANQWNSASRTRFDFLVCDGPGRTAVFAVAFADPALRTPAALRTDRMANAVCDAVGLEVLRVESAALRPDPHGRRIVEYVIDARTYTAGMAGDDDPPPECAVGYRDILGRLPDGRTGFVNDLGAVARAVAIDAYAARELADPLVRGLHVCWRNGPAEGWAWVEVRDGWCLVERTRLWPHRFWCGVGPGRLAEDLATAAIGERLRTLATEPAALVDKRRLAGDVAALRRRRAEMDAASPMDHLAFD